MSLVRCSSRNGEVGSSIIQALALYTRFFEADNSVENKPAPSFSLSKEYFVRFNHSVASEITFFIKTPHEIFYGQGGGIEIIL